MSLSFRMLFITLSFFIVIGLNAQNKDEYQTYINKSLAKGDCAKAQIWYSAYKKLFGNDNEIESRIENCGKRIDTKINELYLFKFDECYPYFNQEKNLVTINGIKYVIDKYGNKCFEVEKDVTIDPFSDGLARICKKNKVGFVNSKGEQIIPPIYDYGSGFSEGIAKVGFNGNPPNFINTNGEIIFKSQYSDEGFYFKNGLIWVRYNFSYGFVDKTGKLLIPTDYSDFNEFHDDVTMMKKDRRYYAINKFGSVIFTTDKFEYLSYFSEGLAPAMNDNKWGFIDKNGNIAIEFKYETVGYFHEGRALVKNNGLYGYVNKNGVLTIQTLWNKVGDFSDGLAVVSDGKKYGFIDLNGKLIIPLVFDSAYSFKEGLACVEFDGKLGFINKNGEKVL